MVNETAFESAAVEPAALPWSDHEVLLLQEHEHTRSWASTAMRATMQLAMLAVLLHIAINGWQAAMAAGSGAVSKPLQRGPLELPF